MIIAFSLVTIKTSEWPTYWWIDAKSLTLLIAGVVCLVIFPGFLFICLKPSPSYPDHCQRYAGTLTTVRGMQVPWPVAEVCRYPDQCQRYAGTLPSARGMQVPWPVSEVCMYPDQCQRYAGTLTSARGMQVSWPVPEVCRYPDQCQRNAGRYHDQCQRYAGTLTSLLVCKCPDQ